MEKMVRSVYRATRDAFGASHNVFEQVRSSNGYEREAALIEIGRFPDPKYLPDTIERLNDWVPQVRAAALRAFEAVVEKAVPADLLRAWCAMDLLARARRANHQYAIAAFQRRVTVAMESSARDALIEGDSGLLAAFLFRSELEHYSDVNCAYVVRRLGARHARVSTIATEWIDKHAAPEEKVPAIRSACTSQHPRTRQWALRQIELLPADEAKGILHDHLFELNSTVRNIVSLKLRLTQTDHLNLAEETLDRSSATRGQHLEALRVIAKLGDVTFLERLTKTLDNTQPLERAIAGQGILRIDSSKANDVFVSVATTIEGRALRYFTTSCARANVVLSRDALLRVWRTVNEQKRCRLVALVEGLGRWEAWCFLANVVGSDATQVSDGVKRLAARLVKSQVFVKPTTTQKETIRNAFESIRNLFDSIDQGDMFDREMRDNGIDV
jgi:hypothetical protein